MGDFKINGQVVSESDWNAFKGTLVRELPSSKAIFDDNVVSKDELVSMLDADKDKKLTYKDFNNVDRFQFGSINELLIRHGFSIGAEAGKNISKISYYDINSSLQYLVEDRDFMLAAVKTCGSNLKFASENVKNSNISVAELPGESGGKTSATCIASLREDREIVLAAVKVDGSALQYADPSFKKDREVVLAAVKNNAYALSFADPSFKKDREIVLAAVKEDGGKLCSADPSFKKDREIVLAAVGNAAYALSFADPSFKKDREFVLAAVKENGLALEYADPSFKKDREVVLAAVKNNAYALSFADPSFEEDREIILAAVKENGLALQYADRPLRKDKDIVLAAVKGNGFALQYADPPFKKDREVVLAAVKANGGALKYADPLFKKDREFVLAAVINNCDALKYADASLLADSDFFYATARSNIGVLDSEHVGEDVRRGVWKRILGDLNNFSGLNIPKHSLATYGLFKKYIKEEYNIEFFARLKSINTFMEILKIRNSPIDHDDSRPTAVVVSPKKDCNNALEHYPTIDRLVELGYRVVYYEVDDERQANYYLSEATGGGKNAADLIVLLGHGSSTTLALGGDDLGSGGRMSDETNYIDTMDFEDGSLDINLLQYLKLSGDLLLISCSNGEGEEGNPDNLANTISRIMPREVTVLSATRPVTIRNIFKSSEGKLKVEWSSGPPYAPKGGHAGKKS